MDFVLPRAHTFADVASTDYSHQPQWDTRGVCFRYSHTQSVWGALPTAKQDPQMAEHICATCKFIKSKCVCSQCFLCKASVGFGTRHHCRKCWKTCCKSCRSRLRYVNPLVENSVAELTCDQCSVLRGISSLDTAEGSRIGLLVLIEAADMPRRCIGETCSTLSYMKTCPSCYLPTAPTAPYVERLIRLEYCCRWSKKCAKCIASERRMRELEAEARATRENEFAGVCASFMAKSDLGRTVSRRLEIDPSSYMADRAEILLLSVVCSSICYEYAFFPGLSLNLSDIPHAHYLVLRESNQLFSSFEGPNRTLFIALPGTHDLRTVLTDAQFTRVIETQLADICGGYLDSGRMLHQGVTKLWDYKVHSGFLQEEVKLRSVLSTSMLRRYVVEDGFHLVFCGHSLGGALAVLSTLRVLSDDLSAFNGKVSCVTIGAPFVGNSALTRKVQRCGWEKYFHHFVYRADIIPRLLCAPSMPKEIVQNVQDHVTATVLSVQSAVQNFFRGRRNSQAPPATIELAAVEDCPSDSREGSEPQQSKSTDETVQVSMQRLLVGDHRAFDTFGHYYLLFRDGSLCSHSLDPCSSFLLLRKAPAGGSSAAQFTDHLIDSYNRAIAQLLR